VHKSIENLQLINNEIRLKVKENIHPNVIAVSKTFQMPDILPLIEYGHIHFGENKVQEALEKWENLKLNNSKIKLHLIGGLQSNKVKLAIKLFDYIHSVDNEKLIKKIADEQIKQNKKVKIFIQVNIGNEEQKSGVLKKNLNNLFNYAQSLGLNIVGLMCIPPQHQDPEPFFKELRNLSEKLNIKDLSMGMSADYILAVENSASFLRIGSKIFGNRIKKF
jgi:pyridoxal phosphate enzyme (YggS family)